MKTFMGHYVTQDGELYSMKTGAKKYTWLNKGRAGFYERTQFWIDGKKKNLYVHRIVAMLYLPDWDSNLEVDHIDEDTLNNRVENLSMKSRTDNQLEHEQRKEAGTVYKVLRMNNKCIFKQGQARTYSGV